MWKDVGIIEVIRLKYLQNRQKRRLRGVRLNIAVSGEGEQCSLSFLEEAGGIFDLRTIM
jgi:hypothetical protein